MKVTNKLLAMSAGAGLAVLVTGYIPLRLFWEFSRHITGLPGLFYYPDATWGDGLLLPLLAFFVWLVIGRLAAPRRRWPTLAAAVGGATAGLLLILTWWADPHPSPNWTLPRPHHFTVAGQWHAGFLVAASAFFAGSWVELFRRIRTAVPHDAAQMLASPMLASAIGARSAMPG
jgi:hypothetical protein